MCFDSRSECLMVKEVLTEEEIAIAKVLVDFLPGDAQLDFYN